MNPGDAETYTLYGLHMDTKCPLRQGQFVSIVSHVLQKLCSVQADAADGAEDALKRGGVGEPPEPLSGDGREAGSVVCH